MLEPLHFPHRWSGMCCAFWLLCGSCDDGGSMIHDAASHLMLQRARAHSLPPPTVSVKESNCAVVDFVVGGMAEGCTC